MSGFYLCTITGKVEGTMPRLANTSALKHPSDVTIFNHIYVIILPTPPTWWGSRYRARFENLPKNLPLLS